MSDAAEYVNNDILIEADELESRLGDPALRIIDCDIRLQPKPEGGYEVTSGLANWEAAHIPGSVYVHIGAELSAPHPRLRYMLPTADQFAGAMSDRGIGSDHDIVLYARDSNFWATRLFLMFRSFGSRNVKVLNGGWNRWADEGRPTTTDAQAWPRAEFVASPPDGLFVDQAVVERAIADGACVINALSPALHTGETFNNAYGRPGHIAGSVNLFFNDLIHPDTYRFLDRAALEEKLKRVGALDAVQVITYCGGGISATVDAFALLLLGRDDVKVYDGSLSEWGHDNRLPMETGE